LIGRHSCGGHRLDREDDNDPLADIDQELWKTGLCN
jgi:hypothetical protein